jgi:hypothetical protein
MEVPVTGSIAVMAAMESEGTRQFQVLYSVLRTDSLAK